MKKIFLAIVVLVLIVCIGIILEFFLSAGLPQPNPPCFVAKMIDTNKTINNSENARNLILELKNYKPQIDQMFYPLIDSFTEQNLSQIKYVQLSELSRFNLQFMYPDDKVPNNNDYIYEYNELLITQKGTVYIIRGCAT